MKHKRLFTMVCLMYALFVFTPVSAQVDTVTVIHVNDSHSNLLPFADGGFGGIARMASVVGLWKMTEPNPVALHGGDFFVGSLMFNTYFGVPELQILNSIGFDALQLGNHEFDAGPEQLGGILAMAEIDSSFDIICSNALNTAAVPTLDSIIRPYAIETRGDLKIGIFGMTTPEANLISNPAPVFIDTNLVQIAFQQIQALKGEGCQVVIMLSHLGLALDMQLAGYLSGCDLIVGAHSHDLLQDILYINNIPIVQAGSYYHYAGKIRLVYDGNSTSVLDYTVQEITDQVPEEPTIAGILESLKLGVQAQYEPVIGDPYRTISYVASDHYAYPQNLDRLDTPMGNLITAALYDYVPEADCAIEANGHLVEGIYTGPLTPADLFRTYSYGYDASDGLGFRLASFDIYGAELLGAMNALNGFIVPEFGYYDYLLQSCNLSFSLDMDGSGQLSLGEVTIGGQPVAPESTYTIASSDQVVGYLINLFGIEPQNLNIYPVSAYQVVLDYVARLDTVDFVSDGHNSVTPVEKADGNPVIVSSFELGSNYPNPFNPETTIPFKLDRAADVVLEVYSVTGQRVATLLSAYLPAGSYKIRWNGQSQAGFAVSSGIYLYRIRAGGQEFTRRMVLIR